jgi:purine-binding chemotaxis protein CheW
MESRSVGTHAMEEPRAGALDVLIFRLWGERYAVPLAQVREVVRVVAITRLADSSALLEGVVDVRGELVPVLDLRALLGCAPKAVELSDELVFIAAGGRTLAFRSEPPSALSVVDSGLVVETQAVVAGFRSALSMVQQPEGLVLLLDTEALLPLPELFALDAELLRYREGGA